MKYVINRQFAFTGFKYDINQNSRTVYRVKVKRSKEVEGQFDVVIYDPVARFAFGQSAFVKSDPKHPQTYRIFIKNNGTDTQQFFGYLQYRISEDQSRLYQISIGSKQYRFRSKDLRSRRLTMIDSLGTAEAPSSPSSAPYVQCQNTIFQVTDSFSETNDAFHVTIDNQEMQLGYLALVILLDLHECRKG